MFVCLLPSNFCSLFFVMLKHVEALKPCLTGELLAKGRLQLQTLATQLAEVWKMPGARFCKQLQPLQTVIIVD